MSDNITHIDTKRKEMVNKFKDFQSNRDNFDDTGNIKLDILDNDMQDIMFHLYDPIRKMCENAEPLIKDNLERNLQKFFAVRYYDINSYKGIIHMKRNQLFNIFNDITGSVTNYTFDIQKSFGNFNFDSLNVEITSTINENYGLPFVVENIENGFSFEFWSNEMLTKLVDTNTERYTMLPLLMTQSKDRDKKKDDLSPETDGDLINLAHISIVIIDKELKKIYHYDSNGQYSYYYEMFKDTMGDIVGELLDKMVNDYLLSSFPDYQFEKVYDFPPLNNVTSKYQYDFDKGHCMINSIIMPNLLYITGKSIEELGKLFNKLPNHILTIMVYTFASNLAHNYMKHEVKQFAEKDKRNNSISPINQNQNPNINTINTHNNNVLSTINNQQIPNTPYTNHGSQFNQFQGSRDDTINLLTEKIMLLESRLQHIEDKWSEDKINSIVVAKFMEIMNSEMTEM